MSTGRILALGGGGFSTEPDNPLLDDYLLSLVPGTYQPRVCFVPTASGDSDDYVAGFEKAFTGRARTSVLSLFARQHTDLRSFLLEQDIVFVGGGSTANLLAVWRLHTVLVPVLGDRLLARRPVAPPPGRPRSARRQRLPALRRRAGPTSDVPEAGGGGAAPRRVRRRRRLRAAVP